MTINEYKGRFLDLFEEMQKEHGAIRSVYIKQNIDMLQAGAPLLTSVTIEF